MSALWGRRFIWTCQVTDDEMSEAVATIALLGFKKRQNSTGIYQRFLYITESGTFVSILFEKFFHSPFSGRRHYWKATIQKRHGIGGKVLAARATIHAPEVSELAGRFIREIEDAQAGRSQ